MLSNIPTQHTQTCKDCTKNKNLLKKYEKLTQLYEKKQLKLTTNGSSLISNGKTTNNTLEAQSSYMNCLKMAQALTKLLRIRCQPLFRIPSEKSAKKFILFSLCNRLEKSSKVKAFLKIKEVSFVKTIDNELSLQQNSGPAQILNRKDHGFSVIKQLIDQQAAKPEEFVKKAIQELSRLKETAFETNNNEKQLRRKNMQLEIMNRKLTLQNKALKQCIDQLDKRLSKQNQKKRQTLEELADEINEKNQQINQLKQTLKTYEITQEMEGKVLEDDFISMKKDIEQLQKLNERLNNDLEKVKNQLIETNKKLKLSEEKNSILQKQCMTSHKQNHILTIQIAKTEKLSNESSKLIKSLQKKLKRLTVYQKYQEDNSLSQNTNTLKIQQELKSQLILMFLANISDAEYCLKSQHLFDEEEKSLLMTHRENWIKLQNQTHARGHRNHHQNRMDCLEISEIQTMKAIQMESMMNALDSPRNHDNREREGPTMRMLELQLENNRQVGKITELKEKFLHIRVIILKLLKSLELSSDVKSQTREILRVLFDFFEYSQEQRDSIFIKKKRMFGFI